jgi:hypothetical protein
VAVILPDTSWALTDRFNKRLSVFDRGVRIYFPGLDADADPYAHPLWLGARLANYDEGVQVDRQVRMRVAQFSTRSVRMGDDILPFSQLRSVSRKAEQDRLANSGASDSEKLVAAENRIAALTKELGKPKNWRNTRSMRNRRHKIVPMKPRVESVTLRLKSRICFNSFRWPVQKKARSMSCLGSGRILMNGLTGR